METSEDTGGRKSHSVKDIDIQLEQHVQRVASRTLAKYMPGVAPRKPVSVEIVSTGEYAGRHIVSRDDGSHLINLQKTSLTTPEQEEIFYESAAIHEYFHAGHKEQIAVEEVNRQGSLARMLFEGAAVRAQLFLLERIKEEKIESNASPAELKAIEIEQKEIEKMLIRGNKMADFQDRIAGARAVGDLQKAGSVLAEQSDFIRSIAEGAGDGIPEITRYLTNLVDYALGVRLIDTLTSKVGFDKFYGTNGSRPLLLDIDLTAAQDISIISDYERTARIMQDITYLPIIEGSELAQQVYIGNS